ncbi:MAG TPA: phytoene/squalene synthase family protein [Caulifigura sp.]|nr:phytoene/squalene synthase family protein [Caulifigura sp.]
MCSVVLSVAASVDYCCDLAKRSKTQFYLTFFALPRAMFRDMCVLYAFMRRTDDLADDPALPVEQRAAQLLAWRRDLTRSLTTQTVDDPILPAVADLVVRQGIEPQWLFDVIDGVESDLVPRTFVTFDELNDYCYHVAGAVGLCCIQIWKFDDERAKAAAIACGTAFQLTNILRDVAEDDRNGRVYLPEEDLARFGVTREQLARGGDNPAYQRLMQFEADRARSFYQQSQPLLEWLSPAGRRVQRAMFAMYGGLLDEIERRRFDVQSGRVSVSKLRKLRIAARCFWPG